MPTLTNAYREVRHASHPAPASTAPPAWPAGFAGPRKTHRVPCRVRVAAEGGARVLVGETECVSPNAVVVRVGAALSSGAEVEVLFPRSPEEMAVLDGVVLSARRALTGCFELRIAVRS